jgi:hypothetical protein
MVLRQEDLFAQIITSHAHDYILLWAVSNWKEVIQN